MNTNTEKVYVVMFKSRNKDNKDIAGFKERTKVFFATEKELNGMFEKVHIDFMNFVAKGVSGELCRMYVSVNARNMAKVKKALICKMVEDDDFNLMKMNAEMVSIAMHKENAAEKKWMFDFDDASIDKVLEFVNDIRTQEGEAFSVFPRQTPHGFGVIAERGFDTR